MLGRERFLRRRVPLGCSFERSSNKQRRLRLGVFQHYSFKLRLNVQPKGTVLRDVRNISK
jgi:hypothetical protein